MRSTDRQYKMHFISNIYRFIFFLILLAITIIGIITYYNFRVRTIPIVSTIICPQYPD